MSSETKYNRSRSYYKQFPPSCNHCAWYFEHEHENLKAVLFGSVLSLENISLAVIICALVHQSGAISL